VRARDGQGQGCESYLRAGCGAAAAWAWAEPPALAEVEVFLHEWHPHVVRPGRPAPAADAPEYQRGFWQRHLVFCKVFPVKEEAGEIVEALVKARGVIRDIRAGKVCTKCKKAMKMPDGQYCVRCMLPMFMAT